MLELRGLPVLFGTLIIATQAQAKDVTVTGVGRVLCQDGNGSLTPLPGARVELMDSDCDGSSICDDKMGEATTDSNGIYSVTGTGGDPWNFDWSNPDPYVRVIYNDYAGVRVTDELDRTQWNSSPQHDHDNFSGGTIDFGTYVAGAGSTSSYGTMCSVWQRSRQAYATYSSLMSSQPPAGHYDILYWAGVVSGTPWTNTDTVHWPRGYPSSAAVHEFGHSIRHAADGNGSHFSWDVTRFRYARNHAQCDSNANRIPSDTETMDRAFAFNEGWAEFYANTISNCNLPNWGDRLEGNVASELRQLSIQYGRKALVQTLLNNSNGIHSLGDFKDALTRSGVVASASSPLTVVPLSPAMAEAARSQAEQRRVTAEALASLQTLRERKLSDLARVRAEAAAIRICEPKDCEDAVRRKISPALIQGELRILELRMRRLEAALQPTGGPVIAIFQGGGNGYYRESAIRSREWRNQEDAVLRQAVSAGFENAGILARESPAARQLLRDLRRKIDRNIRGSADNLSLVSFPIAPDDLKLQVNVL